METDEDYATMRESFLLVQSILSIHTLMYFLLMCKKIWLKYCGKQMYFGLVF